MTEYRIEFKESELASVQIPGNVVDCLRKFGEVRQVVKDTLYYWSVKGDVEGLLDMVSSYRGVKIWRLQGELLRYSKGRSCFPPLLRLCYLVKDNEMGKL